jgi:lysophospholipase L1-like esterase
MFSKAVFTWIGFPVYVWQGVALRLRTERLLPPRLPEAGRFDGTGHEIRLLVVGDSSVAGVGMQALDETLGYNVAKNVRETTGRPVRWRAAGANSATAAEIRDHVLPHVDLTDFTHVILVVGTNDMKNFHPIRRFKQSFGTLLYAMRTRFPEARIVWAPVADMTQIPALPRALGRILQMRAELINNMGERLCRERGAVMAEPVPILGPEGFARDGFHAGPAGYRSWAEHLTGYLVPESVLPPGSHLQPGRDRHDHQSGERKLPEIAALAQTGNTDRLDDLDDHRQHDEQ